MPDQATERANETERAVNDAINKMREAIDERADDDVHWDEDHPIRKRYEEMHKRLKDQLAAFNRAMMDDRPERASASPLSKDERDERDRQNPARAPQPRMVQGTVGTIDTATHGVHNEPRSVDNPPPVNKPASAPAKR